MITLDGRRSAAEVILQPNDPIWYLRRSSLVDEGVILTRGVFKSYGVVRCVVELHPANVPRFVVVDPANVFPRLDEE